MNTLEYKRLTTVQAKELADRVRPMLVFLLKFRDRLKYTGFDSDGQLYQVVERAHDAVHHLSVVLHYESCPRGAGYPAKSE